MPGCAFVRINLFISADSYLNVLRDRKEKKRKNYVGNVCALSSSASPPVRAALQVIHQPALHALQGHCRLHACKPCHRNLWPETWPVQKWANETLLSHIRATFVILGKPLRFFNISALFFLSLLCKCEWKAWSFIYSSRWPPQGFQLLLSGNTFLMS